MVILMLNSLKGSEYFYNNLEVCVEDIMIVFKDICVKVIIVNIGGEDSIWLFFYIDFNVICENLKIFMGYFDVIIIYLFCYKVGFFFLYGLVILIDFVENVEMDLYIIEMVNCIFFLNEMIGEI